MADIGTRESIVRTLEARILSGDLPVGAKLPSQRDLERLFQASRPVVREALNILAERNLIRVVPGKGAFVTRPTSLTASDSLQLFLVTRRATVRDLVEARRAIEGETAALAAQRATVADRAMLERALQGMEEAPGLIERVRWDVAFHLGIARAAKNPLLEALFLALAPLAGELMIRSWSDPAVGREGGPYHYAIFTAICQGDPDQARQALLAHLAVPERLYGDDYTRELDWVARRELARVIGPVEDIFALILPTTETGDLTPDGPPVGGGESRQ